MKMRTNLTAVLTACMMVGSMCTAFPASAEETESTYGVLTYTSYGASITITDCDPSATEVEIPQYIDNITVETIGDSAFSNCEALTSVTIPEGIRAIEDDAFENCESLTTLHIPASVMLIGESVFEGCDALESFTISADSDCFQTIDGVLYDYSGTILMYYPSGKADSVYTIPEGTVYFPYFAFDSCPNLTEIVFPASFNTFDSSSLRYCSALETITVAEGNSYYKSVDGVLFSKDGCILYCYPACRKDKTYTIPEGVSEIGENAFYGSTSIQSVICSEGVSYIRSSAFYDCRYLQSIDLPENMISIGSDAFGFCYDLTQIDLPYDLKEIGSWAFCYCTSLTELVLPESLTRINAGIFQGCSGMDTITIPDGITLIDSYAFYDCSAISSVTIPKNVTSIGMGAFDGCTALTDVTYTGTEEEWSAVLIDEDNEPLINAAFSFSSVSADVSIGDIDSSGSVNASDAAIILTAAAAAGTGSASGLTAEQEAAADVNKDGTFDAKDGALILQYAAYTGTGGTMTLAEFATSCQSS